MPFSFDKLDPAIKGAIGEEITAISEQSLAAVQATIARGFREQIPPHQIARQLRQIVGLDERSAQAVLTYEGTLVAGGTTPALTRRLLDRYVKKKIAERARRIARTETMSLLNKGQRSAIRQAVTENFLPEDSERVFILTDDEKLCPICEELEGERVSINEDFPGGDPPLHPNCRCTFGFVLREQDSRAA